MRLITFATIGYKQYEQRMTKYLDWVNYYELDYRPLGIKDLRDDFLFEHRDFFPYRKGYGFYCWKPEIIYEQMKSMGQRGILIYKDVNTKFTADPKPMVERMLEKQDIAAFDQIWVMKDWCKRECFLNMGLDSEEYWNHTQAWAGFIAVRVTAESLDFVDEWNKWCSDFRTVCDGSSVGREFPGFVEHRHDQAILSLLMINRGIPMIPANYNDSLLEDD